MHNQQLPPGYLGLPLRQRSHHHQPRVFVGLPLAPCDVPRSLVVVAIRGADVHAQTAADGAVFLGGGLVRQLACQAV